MDIKRSGSFKSEVAKISELRKQTVQIYSAYIVHKHWTQDSAYINMHHLHVCKSWMIHKCSYISTMDCNMKFIISFLKC